MFHSTGDKGMALQQVLVTGRRMDNDIMKVHGVRYSKNMIRSLFLQCPMISDVWLTADQNQLVLILLTNSSASDEDILKQIRCEIRERFPWFVVPWTGTLIHSIPHLSGKLTNQVIITAVRSSHNVDKEQLSANNENRVTRSLSPSQTTQLSELTVQRLMSEIVGCKLQPNDDFYNAGGDSLRTLILVERLYELGIPHSLQPRDIFAHSTPVSIPSLSLAMSFVVVVMVDCSNSVNSSQIKSLLS